MKLYRFSPIKSPSELMAALEYVHRACHQLCQQRYGHRLPASGNIAIFCHYQEEYQYLTQLRQQLTDATRNFNGKYFKLHQPITFSATPDAPQATYTYLYIRQPDPYRSHVGDLDFFLEPTNYQSLKQKLAPNPTPGLRLFPGASSDMLELHDPDVDVLAYIDDHKVPELVDQHQES